VNLGFYKASNENGRTGLPATEKNAAAEQKHHCFAGRSPCLSEHPIRMITVSIERKLVARGVAENYDQSEGILGIPT
jgi:hypothetical protein